MKYLFEDDLRCFPYGLLPAVCKDKVFGVKGDKNLIKACRTDFCSDTVVFVDTNADNPVTVSLYNKLTRESHSRSNQYVVPIPCVEYYFIKTFLQNISTSVDIILFLKTTESLD